MIKQFFKKVLISYLIIICCVFTPAYRAYAVSAGGWAFSAYDVATSVVTAMKNGGTAAVAVAKSPISAKIAKGIVGGVIAGAALPLAISQITGIALTSLDWVLDPANNSIKYSSKTDVVSYGGYATLEQFCNAKLSQSDKNFGRFCAVSSTGNIYITDKNGGAYGTIGYTTTTKPTGSIPIPTVADKIYDNAKTDSESRSIVNDAVKDYVNSGAADVALDAAKADADATHNCGTGTHWSGSACVADTPSTPSTPTTPDTPFDPSSIIDAIQSVFHAIQSVFDAVMSLPDVINNALDKLLLDIKDFFQPVIDLFTDFIDWAKDKFTALYDAITDFVDWVKAEPTPENPTKPDVTTLPTPPTDSVNISFSGGCPAPKVVPWSFAGRNIDITIPYTPICDTATLLNPLIKLAASLGAVFIIAGIRRGDDG